MMFVLNVISTYAILAGFSKNIAILKCKMYNKKDKKHRI